SAPLLPQLRWGGLESVAVGDSKKGLSTLRSATSAVELETLTVFLTAHGFASCVWFASIPPLRLPLIDRCRPAERISTVSTYHRPGKEGRRLYGKLSLQLFWWR